MATLGHIVWAFCILLPLIFYSRDKFNYKIAFIFLAANQLTSYAFLIIPFHNLIGSFIWAIPLSLLFTYFSRFTLVKSEKTFPLKLEDEGIREVSWMNSYLVVVAGSIPHYFVDQLFHLEKDLHLWIGIDINFEDTLLWGVNGSFHAVGPLMIIGYIIAFGCILLSLYYFKKGFKDTLKYFIIIIGISLLAIITLGIEIFGGELEIAMLFYMILFILVPSLLLVYVSRDIEDNPRTNLDVPKIKRELLLKIISILCIIASILCLVAGIYAILNASVFAAPLISLLGGGTVAQVTAAVSALGFLLIIISILLLIGSIGLLMKKKAGRYLMLIIFTGLFYFGIPFAVALLLCEKEVKEMFNR